MLAAMIKLYCMYAFTTNLCERDIYECVLEENKLKYEESQWTDVPDEKMSIESFGHCARRYGDTPNFKGSMNE